MAAEKAKQSVVIEPDGGQWRYNHVELGHQDISMTQVLADTTRIDPIRQTLKWIGQKRRAFVWLARLLRSASTWLALGLVAVLIDATWPIPASLWLAIVVTLAVALAVVLILSRPHQDDPQRQPLQ